MYFTMEIKKKCTEIQSKRDDDLLCSLSRRNWEKNKRLRKCSNDAILLIEGGKILMKVQLWLIIATMFFLQCTINVSFEVVLLRLASINSFKIRTSFVDANYCHWKRAFLVHAVFFWSVLKALICLTNLLDIRKSDSRNARYLFGPKFGNFDFQDGDFVYYCKLNGGRCQKVCVGCQFRDKRLYDGDRYQKDNTVFQCEVRPDKYGHKPVGCVVWDENGDSVERIVGCRW